MMLVEAPERCLDVVDDYDVLIWRFEQLRGAGYDEAAASDLAARGDIDLHAARKLLEQGCSQRLALRILR